MSNKNIWYLPGPFHQYQEDVKALAKQNGLRIVDANATNGRDDEADDVPEVTVRQVDSAPVLLISDSGNYDGAAFQELIGKLNAERDSIVLLIDAAEGLIELEHPGGGELPIRLFDALDGIRLQMETLAGERDSEAEKARLLQKQVDDLLAQAAQARLETDETKEAKEIAELKAKLDAAGVPYRANASKESLEKAVSELPKA
ncbi:hypothetical protein SAMN05216509_5340 [Pseudomonas sp. B10]|uniref:hypothetical protein n=1 Tax=Pseudomonas sp. B10 TaxID=118613 RepID=UPI0009537AA6|nr:hypothetical protein [Pseudomonas sp. B10]SIR84150.1 hypothetical protein SAMN05216509_5340 [Pseudomonas sp. B10]